MKLARNRYAIRAAAPEEFVNVNYRKPTLEVCAEGKLVSTMPYEEEEKAIALITVN